MTQYANKFENYILDWISLNKIPGIALAIVDKGQLIFDFYDGFSNSEAEIPVNSSTAFDIASITKQFCSFAILILQQEGLISISDRITKYFNDVHNHWSEITIRHLLSHTSVIINYYKLPDDKHPSAETIYETINYINSLPLDFQPGEQWAYCNTGYMMLAVIVAKVTGMSFETFVQERLLRPIGMNTTNFISQQGVIPNKAEGYIEHNGLWKMNTSSSGGSPPPGPTGMISTLPDLIKWGIALDEGGLIDPQLIKDMWQPFILNNGGRARTIFLDSWYGYGWCMSELESKRILWTPGATSGFTCTFVYVPALRRIVIGLCNGSKLPDFNWFNAFLLGSDELIIGDI